MRFCFAFLSLALFAAPASAAVEVMDFSFSATTSGLAGDQTGSFSVSYDDMANAYALTDISYSVGGTAFDLTNAGVFFTNSGTVTVGGKAGGPIPGPFGFPIGGDMISGGIGVLQAGADDFLLNLNRSSDGKLTAGSFFYAPATGGLGFASAASGTLTLKQLNGAVPEPATWAMMIGGFALAGAAARRRARASMTLA